MPVFPEAEERAFAIGLKAAREGRSVLPSNDPAWILLATGRRPLKDAILENPERIRRLRLAFTRGYSKHHDDQKVTP